MSFVFISVIMKSSTKIVIAIIVIICLGFIIIPRWDKGSETPEENSAITPESNKLEVLAVIAQSKKLNNDLRITGSLTANESVELKSEVSGVVRSILFKEGQKVIKGQLLVELNDEEFKAELEKLQYTKKLNEDIEYRQKQLLAKEAISTEEYEMSLTTLQTSIAEIKINQVQIEKHKIRAPFSGTVGLREISEGSYISPSDLIATIYSIDPIKVDFSIPGRYISELNIGDQISFTVDAFDESFEGAIYAIEPQIDPETRSIKVRAVSDNSENKLLPGQFARVNLTISTVEEAIMIPTEAIIPELNGKKVYVFANGKAASKEVTTGLRTADKIQVTTGLVDSDTVITTGILQLRPGMEVDINLQSE
ncbi:MAG: efflux RND transporter periplasmic adaptor subunit [Bacteroidota bacterium]